jgi:hypothetical protein
MITYCKLEKTDEEAAMDHFEELSWHSSGKVWEKVRTILVKIRSSSKYVYKSDELRLSQPAKGDTTKVIPFWHIIIIIIVVLSCVVLLLYVFVLTL